MAAAGAGRAAARPDAHRRRLRPGRVRGHPGLGDRLPDHPRVLALRHRGGVRQGPGEHRPAMASTRPRTFAEAANLAVNQTLVRSINTSVVALLPVAAILFIGAFLLGAGTLKDISLALFVGIAAGTYSSIFIATPLLVDLREREPKSGHSMAQRGPAAPRPGAGGATIRAPWRTPATRPRTPTRRWSEAGVRAARGRRPQGAGRCRTPARRRPAAASRSARTPPASTSRRRPGRRRPGPGRDPGRPRLPAARGSCSRTSPRCWPTGRRSRAVVDALAAPHRDGAGRVDLVAGIEARGFILGGAGRAGRSGSASSRSARRASCRTPRVGAAYDLEYGTRRDRGARGRRPARPAGAGAGRRAGHRRHGRRGLRAGRAAGARWSASRCCWSWLPGRAGAAAGPATSAACLPSERRDST